MSPYLDVISLFCMYGGCDMSVLLGLGVYRHIYPNLLVLYVVLCPPYLKMAYCLGALETPVEISSNGALHFALSKMAHTGLQTRMKIK